MGVEKSAEFYPTNMEVDHSWKFKGNLSVPTRPPKKKEKLQGNKASIRPFWKMMVDDPFIRPAIFFWRGGFGGQSLNDPLSTQELPLSLNLSLKTNGTFC